MSFPTESSISHSNSVSPVFIPDNTTTNTIPIKSDQYEPQIEQEISQALSAQEDDTVIPVGSISHSAGSFMKRACDVATMRPSIAEEDINIDKIILEADSTEPENDIERALKLRDKLDALLRRTMRTKQQCERLEQDNEYLQEFVGNLMNSGDYLTRKV